MDFIFQWQFAMKFDLGGEVGFDGHCSIGC